MSNDEYSRNDHNGRREKFTFDPKVKEQNCYRRGGR